MASHEWPLPPPLLKSSSSRRKQLSREALAAVDWHKPRRFESLSDDDDDDLPSPYSRDPIERACQSSGKGAFNGSGYGDNRGFQSFGYYKRNALPSSSYGDIRYSTTFNKDAKVKLSTNRRVDHTSLAPQQNAGPLWLNPCPFSSPLRLTAARTHPTLSGMLVNEKKSIFNSREPSSPDVSCLGRVRIKENHGHIPDDAIREGDDGRGTHEVKKQSVDKNHLSDGAAQSRKLRCMKEAAERGGCLVRRKGREAVSAVAVSVTAETRRERAAALARSLTSLLEDLRKLQMEKESYEQQYHLQILCS
ncbi:hypothetical protein L7F22_013414 [Adiantum nelumboides]|nr:hypothetical protein [Adiantum nelumboides]